MSSVTTSIFTARNTTDTEVTKKVGETEITFKKNTAKLNSNKKTLSININSREEKTTSNIKQEPVLTYKVHNLIKNEPKEDVVITKSILKNKLRSCESLTKLNFKAVKFMDELPEDEDEDSAESDKLKKTVTIKENNSTTPKQKKTSNKQLAQIIYIPSLKNIGKQKTLSSYDRTNLANKNRTNLKKNIVNSRKNIVEDKVEGKVDSKCCLIF